MKLNPRKSRSGTNSNGLARINININSHSLGVNNQPRLFESLGKNISGLRDTRGPSVTPFGLSP